MEGIMNVRNHECKESRMEGITNGRNHEWKNHEWKES